MYLRKLALSVGRLDFWELEEQFSPYEIAVHYIADQLEPLGEDRADMREAMSRIIQVQSERTQPLTEKEIDTLLSRMCDYYPAAQKDEQQTPEQAAKLARAMFARVSK